jgi:S1-C subfamily serine protease
MDPASTPRRSQAPRGAWWWVLLLGALALAIAGCNGDDAPAPDPEAQAPTDPFAAIPDLVDEVVTTTVSIEIAGTQLGQAVEGAASGVIFSSDGIIVTNAHVVVPADELTVVLADGARHEADVVAFDERTDLAVVSIDETDLPAARFADELPRIGQLAVAIGNPLGFQDTATVGIVSGLERSLPVVEGGPVLVGLIQTDAAISSGNSGGALVDADGAVIGVNVAVVEGQGAGGAAQGLGFAIPSTTVIPVVEELIDRGEVAHAYLGIEGIGLTPQVAERFGHDRDRGVLVGRVQPGSPAEQAGLGEGDVLVELDGATIASLPDLFAELRARSPGDEVTVTVVRDGEEQDVEVTLGELPDEAG